MVKDGNERVTVTLPVTIVERIKKLSAASGFSKSTIVRVMIEAGLNDDEQ